MFTGGAIPEDDGTVKICRDGADRVQRVRTTRIDRLVDLCLDECRPAMGT